MNYVIGDIHGQIDALKILLRKLNLQPEDRVYFVGDWFDRQYTIKDLAETVKWMLENLTEGSQFRSVLGNHDLDQLNTIRFAERSEQENSIGWQMINMLPVREEEEYIRDCYPELKRLIERMPIYEEFTAGNQKFLVTHSWLVDENLKIIGTEGFDISKLNVTYSIWDREYSECEYEYTEDMPIVIHGHTPTIGRHDVYEHGCRALARIKKIGEKNINVDCCAFYSPLRGGNLAAYRCEDGAEFYAYEDDVFYTLVDEYFEKNSADEAGVSWEGWYFATLFYRRYLGVLCRKDVEIPDFQNERAKQAFLTIRAKFAEGDSIETAYEAEQYIGGIKEKIHEIVPQYWVESRERFC